MYEKNDRDGILCKSTPRFHGNEEKNTARLKHTKSREKKETLPESSSFDQRICFLSCMYTALCYMGGGGFPQWKRDTNTDQSKMIHSQRFDALCLFIEIV